MTGSLADSAIHDCVFVRADVALLEIDLSEFRGWLECGIIVCGRLPRHALCPGNMAAAEHAFLRILGHVRDLASVFARRTHVYQWFTTFTLRQRFIEKCANLLVETFLRHRITRLRIFWNLARHRAAFR